MNEDITSILEAGLRAPSGENAQPWRFKIERDNSGIDVYIDPIRDNSAYSWGKRSAFFSAGTVIENMRQAAAALHYRSQIDVVADTDSDLAARIRFHKDETASSNLAAAIATRSTNRKPYETKPLSQTVSNELSKCSEPGIAITLTHDRDDILKLATAASTTERVMLNNKALHDFFFGHVTWTAAEDRRVATGFFIDTLELPAPARIGFKLIRSWKRATVLNRAFSFNSLVAKQNAVVHAAASAFGVVSTTEESAKAATTAGMAFERAWLTATREGYWLQPLAGILYLGLRVKAGELAPLTADDTALVAEANSVIAEAGKLGTRQPYMMFRIGSGPAPTTRSTRRELNSFLETI